MTTIQAVNETKYRLLSIVLDQLLQKKAISEDEYISIKKQLKKRLKPVIGTLEVIEIENNKNYLQ